MPTTNGTRPVEKAAPAFAGLELGVTGLKQNKGILSEEWLPHLRGAKGRAVYRSMADNDGVVGATMYALAQLVRRSEWSTEPADGQSEDDPAVEFAESLRDDMSHSWSALIGEIMFGMPVYGWQAHEVVYKRRSGPNGTGASRSMNSGALRPGEGSRYTDGRIGWRKLPVRAQDTLVRWEFGDDGGVAGMWQQTPDGPVLIPIEKLALFRTSTAKGNPEGRSALRTAYRSWYLKTRVEEQEAIGIERDLTGIPMFGLPEELLNPSASGTTLAAREAFENIGKNLRNDEQATLLMPLAYDQNNNPRYSFELVPSPGTHQVDTGPVITRHNQTIAMTLLADVILLGHEKVGTQALAVSKVDLLAASLDAWLEGIAEVFNRHLLPRVFALNGQPTGELPQYKPSSVKPDDVAAMVDQIAKLAQAGTPLFPSESLEEWLADQVGYPKPDPMEMPMVAPMPEDEPVDEMPTDAVEDLT